MTACPFRVSSIASPWNSGEVIAPNSSSTFPSTALLHTYRLSISFARSPRISSHSRCSLPRMYSQYCPCVNSAWPMWSPPKGMVQNPPIHFAPDNASDHVHPPPEHRQDDPDDQDDDDQDDEDDGRHYASSFCLARRFPLCTCRGMFLPSWKVAEINSLCFSWSGGCTPVWPGLAVQHGREVGSARGIREFQGFFRYWRCSALAASSAWVFLLLISC